MAIKLIVGLGNPGKKYQSHRHNIGFWFVDSLANLFSQTFTLQNKFFGEVAKINKDDKSLFLLKPNTYMNLSGKSIAALANFYQISADDILIVHDDLDLNSGIAKLKFSGGHGGHNGLRDTISALKSKDFYRLRIGINHPGGKSQVSNFVLSSPNKEELKQIKNAIVDSLQIIDDVIEGNIEVAMNTLHSNK